MSRTALAAALVAAGLSLVAWPAYAQLAFFSPASQPTVFDRAMRDAPSRQVPFEATEEERGSAALPAHMRRQIVSYTTSEPAGTIIVDTPNTYLYLVLGNGQAIRYGVGVGRQGFTWSGRERITKKAEWPDWHPPAEMIGRQPFLPRFMAGGPGNPMGSRAMYLGKTMYRIHGTNEPHMIGQFGSSGCIRMLNEDAEDLYRRVGIGTQVVVLPAEAPAESAAVNAPRPLLR